MVPRLLQLATKWLRLIRPFVIRELQERYVDSAIGMAWNLVKPAVQILIYWWVFDVIFKIEVASPYVPEHRVPFLFYLLTGILPWLGIQEAIERGTGAVLDHRGLVSKIRFSLWVFPLSAVLAVALAYTAIYLPVMGFYLWIDGGLTTARYLYLLIGALGALFFATGFALIFSALSVYLRDLPHILSLLLMICFYSAPILYSSTLVPEGYRTLLMINPYFSIVEVFHHAFLWRVAPAPVVVAVALVYPALFLIAGIVLFRKLEPGFSDVL